VESLSSPWFFLSTIFHINLLKFALLYFFAYKLSVDKFFRGIYLYIFCTSLRFNLNKSTASVVVRFWPLWNRNTWQISQIMEGLDLIPSSWSYPTTWLTERLQQLGTWWVITRDLSCYPHRPARSLKITHHSANCNRALREVTIMGWSIGRDLEDHDSAH